MSAIEERPQDRADPNPVATCPARLSIAGESFACDWPWAVNGSHEGWAHSNREAQAIWVGDEGVSGGAQ